MLLLVLLPALAAGALASGQCTVDLDSVSGKYPPLLVHDGAFLLPTVRQEERRVLTLQQGGSLQLLCHGSERYQASTYLRRADTAVRESLVPLTCSNGEFTVSGTSEKIAVEKATCNRKQEPRMERTAQQCSPVGADGRTEGLDTLVRVSIGWQVGQDYIEQIGLCIDEKTYGTVWTNHTLHGASIDLRDIDPGRPSFRADLSGYSRRKQRFFTWSTSSKMNKLYSKKSQRSTVTALLGGVTQLEGELIIETSSSGTDYFAKGHLSPDAAFVYNVLQDATYYFVNVAPQFQSFNNGNWKALEGAVRDLGQELSRDLKVTTGTHGVLEYPDKDNKAIGIFLARIESYVPAPQYYWKTVEDPATGTAVTFIGLNDPHTNTPPTELCLNRCAEMSWVDWDVTRLDSGYMYCCSAEDAAKAIPAIPAVSAPGGLLGGSQGGGGQGEQGSCQAGPCNCSCVKNVQGTFSCTCTCT